ncbi:helix-turn-helix domain-containing protein [Streptomyces sp. NPDC086549]|uniref:helix-turn-helix domain-containing protein n=1 Tax=Streptomyces sp. NPDC086549 TaxID=3365752 RepID=UPI00381F490B
MHPHPPRGGLRPGHGLLTPRPLQGRADRSRGRGDKIIDRRAVLEAKRLLAHGDPPASCIAAQLGSTSATNFSKFFHQFIGHSPIASRATDRRRSSEDGQGHMPGTGRPHR